MCEAITYEAIALHATMWLTGIAVVAVPFILMRVGFALSTWLARKGL